MSVRFLVNNRKDFILFGKVVAETLRTHDADRQWIISLQGDNDSGKSILPLAADWQRNPHRYRIGIQRYHYIHRMVAYHHPEYDPKRSFKHRNTAHLRAPHQAGEEKIYFNDGLGKIIFHKANYAEPWKELLTTLPNTKLIFLSNVWNWTKLRTKSNAEDADKKILIDMRIFVQIPSPEDKAFIRLVNYTTGDKDLDKKIKSRFDEALRTSQPSAPARKRKRAQSSVPDIGK